MLIIYSLSLKSVPGLLLYPLQEKNISRNNRYLSSVCLVFKPGHTATCRPQIDTTGKVCSQFNLLKNGLNLKDKMGTEFSPSISTAGEPDKVIWNIRSNEQ